jgi:hypothetical protein
MGTLSAFGRLTFRMIVCPRECNALPRTNDFVPTLSEDTRIGGV